MLIRNIYLFFIFYQVYKAKQCKTMLAEQWNVLFQHMDIIQAHGCLRIFLSHGSLAKKRVPGWFITRIMATSTGTHQNNILRRLSIPTVNITL